MTAIAGVWSFKGSASSAEPLSRMLRALSIYGPDSTTQYSDGPIAIGRCLLGLLPEDRFDCQPLSSQGITALVADIRLDNRQELIGDLGIPNGAEIADSAILLEAWRKWGKGCLSRLLGAFAFAVWNAHERELFVARDPMGERPLYYFSSPEMFAFASMPKGLHVLPQVGAEVDEDYVAHYLALAAIPAEQTIFRRIVRLPSGCALTVSPGKTEVRRHWSMEAVPPLALASDEDYLELFREHFDSAVRARLRTTGGIAAQLSGGLDSASVAATAARLLGAEGRDLVAYTAVPRSGFDARESADHFEDEGPAAAAVAALYPNMRHVPVDSSGVTFLDILDHNEFLYDHPCYGPSNEVWENAIMARAQAGGATVLLNGNCGNSTFSYYGTPALSEWLRHGRWSTLARVAWQLRRTRSISFKSIVRSALWPSLPFWFRSRTDPHMRGFSLDYCVLRPEIIRALDLQRRALRDLNTLAPGGRGQLTNLLTLGDVSETNIAPQGGWRLDFRDPTFDRRVVEFCLAVPLEQFLHGGQLRSLGRRAMEGRLPPSTLTRTKRGRQSADWYVSLCSLEREMLAEVALLEASPLASRMLDLPRMRQLIGSFPSGGFDQSRVQGPYHAALTRGFSVGRFLRRHDPDLRQPFSAGAAATAYS